MHAYQIASALKPLLNTAVFCLLSQSVLRCARFVRKLLEHSSGVDEALVVCVIASHFCQMV